ncbi:MAG TPA: SRPBCC domain-containing protein [Bryobacteraceae bacterium]|nr:SRPBCC domain-containing protein [Bryobacteraceae bacterium]
MSSSREIIASRIFDAPRELVFETWTDPTHISNWWGPRGFQTVTHEMDVRPGGVWRHTMRGPDGRDYPNETRYVEVVSPERLVYEHISPPEFQTTVTFVETGGKTRVNVRMVFESAELRDRVALEYGAVEGLNQTLERLGEELASMSQPQFEISRTFDAPRDLVWKAFTESKRLMHWWGPRGLSWVSGKLDLRPGGMFHYCMRSPEGQEMWGKFVYREIDAPARLVFVNSFCDAAGDTVRAPFNAQWPLEVLNTVTFSEHAGRTTITVRGGPINAPAEEREVFRNASQSMEQGFSGTFDQLTAYLVTQRHPLVVRTQGDREIVLTRVFDAPRDLVFEAWTKPQHVVHWYGRHGWNLEVCEIDLRVGGRWRYVMRGPKGRSIGLGGAYLEIARPERLVSTESFDDYPGESINTVTLTEQNGQTTLTITGLASSTEIRDAIIKSGMEEGAAETMDRLAGVLASLSAGERP